MKIEINQYVPLYVSRYSIINSQLHSTKDTKVAQVRLISINLRSQPGNYIFLSRQVLAGSLDCDTAIVIK